jgi:hypothetical protein
MRLEAHALQARHDTQAYGMLDAVQPRGCNPKLCIRRNSNPDLQDMICRNTPLEHQKQV